jgi:hypothetical protein
MGHEMACGQLAHLARADEINVLAMQVAENLLREFDSYRSD